jgi:hypothetical protein
MEVRMPQWKLVDFIRKHYRIQQDEKKELSKAQVEIKVVVNGKQFARLELRQPGMVCLIAKPGDTDGIDLEVIEPSAFQFHDQMLPDNKEDRAVQSWHGEALEVQ